MWWHVDEHVLFRQRRATPLSHNVMCAQGWKCREKVSCEGVLSTQTMLITWLASHLVTKVLRSRKCNFWEVGQIFEIVILFPSEVEKHQLLRSKKTASGFFCPDRFRVKLLVPVTRMPLVGRLPEVRASGTRKDPLSVCFQHKLCHCRVDCVDDPSRYRKGSRLTSSKRSLSWVCFAIEHSCWESFTKRRHARSWRGKFNPTQFLVVSSSPALTPNFPLQPLAPQLLFIRVHSRVPLRGSVQVNWWHGQGCQECRERWWHKRVRKNHDFGKYEENCVVRGACGVRVWCVCWLCGVLLCGCVCCWCWSVCMCGAAFCGVLQRRHVATNSWSTLANVSRKSWFVGGYVQRRVFET